MAAPTVAATNTQDTGGTTSFTHTLATGTGDKLFILSLDGNQTSNFVIDSAGWTTLINTSDPGNVAMLVGYKAGTSDASVQISWTSSERGSIYSARLAGSNFSVTAPESATATGDSTIPDPPNLDPTWTSTDTLVLAVVACDNGNISVSAYPYASNNVSQNTGTANGALVGVCSTTSTGGAINPGTFTISSGEQWVAANIAIAASGTAITGTAAVTLGALTSTASGNAVTAITGTSTVTLAALESTAVGTVGEVGAALTGSNALVLGLL